MKDVHTEHCCAKHGCKYCDKNCTVVTGKLKQSYKSEDCWWEEDDPHTLVKELEFLLKETLPWLNRYEDCHGKPEEVLLLSRKIELKLSIDK